MLSVVCLIRKLLQYAIKLIHSQNVNGQKDFLYDTEKLVQRFFSLNSHQLVKNIKHVKEISRLSSYLHHLYLNKFYTTTCCIIILI